MSILQQGDSQGELCVADLCQEGIAVRGRPKSCLRRREGLACKTHRREGFGEFRWNATQLMRLMCNWRDDYKLTSKRASIAAS